MLLSCGPGSCSLLFGDLRVLPEEQLPDFSFQIWRETDGFPCSLVLEAAERIPAIYYHTLSIDKSESDNCSIVVEDFLFLKLNIQGISGK